MKNSYSRVGILSTFGYGTNSATFLARLVNVESSIASIVHVIAPDKAWKESGNVFFHRVRYKVGRNAFSQIINQITSQLAMAFRLAFVNREVDYWIFFGSDFLLIPAITAKILRTKIVIALAGNLDKETELKKNILNKPQLILKRIVLHLAKHIILFTEILIEQWSMQRYKKKVLIADDHYLDLNIYRIEKPLSQRTKTVGYIGRLSNEKGIINYLSAIPVVLQKQPDTRFLVVGNGPLDDKVKKYIVNEHLEQYVKLVARVSPETVPSYLNQLQLCVLPSYTEGMPNIMIEAMACGTPVLATPVGGIPDIIKDNKTGFIMENNFPESIAANICRALDCTYLEKIAQTARLFAEQRFTFEAASQSYKRISNAMIEHM